MKIIYLEQKEINLGDKISLNGVDVIVTLQLVNAIPNLFKIKEEPKTSLFITDDGVEVFDDDLYWYINKNWHIDKAYAKYGCQSSSTKARFVTYDAAKKYIRRNKQKTLKEYENVLLSQIHIERYIKGHPENFNIYWWLKENEPKLYWTKVLQLIAEDLNENFGNKWWIIEYYDKGYNISSYSTLEVGEIKFSSYEVAENVIEIMENKLDYIFKH